jgi:hypothetical protein
MSLYNTYLEQAKIMHKDSNVWKGHMIKRYMPQIKQIIEEKNIDTILDYGCGKAQHHPDSWNSYKYDPAIPQFSTKPDKNKKFDLVLCVDVLEHIPEESLPEIIKELFDYSNKWVFCTAAVKEAGKTLPNGMNAHATVKPEDWWKELFKPYKNYTLDFTTKKPIKKKKY